MAKIVYPELSYKITGVLFAVHNTLGSSYAEKHYQAALEKAFRAEGIAFIPQAPIPLFYRNSKEVIGHFRADFLVANAIILEIKTVKQITWDHCRQLIRYLKQTGYHLGIIVNFHRQRLETRRIINISEHSISDHARISDSC